MFDLKTLIDLCCLGTYSVIQPSLSLTYESWTHTLRDLVTYSPYAIDSCHLRLLFITYQLLKTIDFFHRRGLSSGPLQLTDVHINERYWIQLKPRFHSCLATIEFMSDSAPTCTTGAIAHHDDDCQSDTASRTNSVTLSSMTTNKTRTFNHNNESTVLTTITTPSPITSTAISHSLVYHVEHRYETYCRTQIDIVELIKQWQLGHVSNFDYLLILNALAGKRFHDPNNHLIFPWINDLTCATANLRDLSQSKYRLNKGSMIVYLLIVFVHLLL
jgi:WD repeat-containing protein 81